MAKKAGRPTGTGHPDGKYLDRMADTFARDPEQSVNSVILAIARKDKLPKAHDEAFRQRLSRKWRKQGPDRLAEARQRHEERNSTTGRAVRGGASVLDGLTQIASPLRNSVFFEIASGMEETASARMLRQLNENPAIKLANEMERIQRMADPFYDLRKSGAFRGILDE